MRRRWAAPVVLLLVATAVMMVPSPADAQDPLEILEIDTYSRTLEPGQRTMFNWTVRNLDALPVNVSVRATGVPGWTFVVMPSLITDLPPNRAAGVQLSVVAPSSVEAATTVNIQVLFTASEGGATVFVASRVATLTIPSIFAEKRVLGVFPNPLPPPLNDEWGVFLLNVVSWGVIALVVLFVVFPSIRRYSSHRKSRVGDIVIRIVRTPLALLLFLYGTLQSADALERHIPPEIRNGLQAIYNAVLAVVVIYLVYRLFKDVVIYIVKNVAKKTTTHVDDIIIPLVEKVGMVIIALAGLGLLLGYLNVDLTVFVAGGVVISMVLAFAAQDTISNFFSGLFILADRPFNEGDIIILGDGDWVEVRRIGMRTTRLFRFSDASIVTVPNNKLVNEKIANFSNPRDRGRLMKTFGVGYGSDPSQVKRIIQEAIDATPYILREDPLKPIVRFDALGESSLDFFVLVWIDDRRNRFEVQDALNTEVYTRLTAAGIEIPFPQRTVHIQLEGRSQSGVPPDVERIARQVMAREREGDRPEDLANGESERSG